MAGLTTHRVVEVAADVADDIGFELVTMTEVARRCGVRVASLYSHVADLEAVREGVARLALDRLAERTAAAVAGRARGDALAALGEVVRRFAAEHPGLHAAARHPLPPAVAAASAGPRIAATMRAVVRGYGLAEHDEVHAVRLLGSVFQGFASLELSGSFGHSHPIPDDSWRQILTVLDHALSDWISPPQK